MKKELTATGKVARNTNITNFLLWMLLITLNTMLYKVSSIEKEIKLLRCTPKETGNNKFSIPFECPFPEGFIKEEGEE